MGVRRKEKGAARGEDHMAGDTCAAPVEKVPAEDMIRNVTMIEGPDIAPRRANPNAEGGPPEARMASKL